MQTAAVILVTLAALVAGGCRVITYESAERKVTIAAFGIDTKVGAIRAETTEGKLEVEGIDSKAEAAALMAEAARIMAK